MKPCVGCKHLTSTWCHVKGRYIEEYDDLILKNSRRYIGVKRIKEMRREDGLCGPDAKLFEGTYRHRLREWIKNDN